MRILLGCGDDVREGWIHHDLHCHADHIDIAHDLNVTPWPFAASSASRIEALDVLEHLDDMVTFMDECWRVLRPGGLLAVQAVHGDSEDLWRDPTHRRGFIADTFEYFDPTCMWWERFGKFYTERPWRLLLVRSWPARNVYVEATPIKLDHGLARRMLNEAPSILFFEDAPGAKARFEMPIFGADHITSHVIRDDGLDYSRFVVSDHRPDDTLVIGGGDA